MNRHSPDLESLLDARGPRERERLHRAHDLLLRAGPPPEMPPSLRKPPRTAVHVLRRAPIPACRRTRAWALIAPVAAVSLLAAGAGAYLSISRSTSVHSTFAMRATAAAPGAFAVVRVGATDHSGNRPITLRVRGLPTLPRGSFYEMYLTNKGRLAGSCGVFRTSGGPTVVELNAPYTLGEYSGWLIRRQSTDAPPGPALLVTQPA